MDVVLLTLTIFSLAAAAGFAVVTWYMLRDARQRSDARIASLAAAIDGEPQASASGLRSTVHGVGLRGTERPDFQPTGDRGPKAADDPAALFNMARRPAAPGRPLLKLAVGFGMAVFIIVAISMSAASRDEPATRARLAAATATAAQPATAPSLELLSMRHEHEADGLIVTGLVRNPGTTAARSITAVIFAFDRAGNFLASGRAPLEYRTLDGGDESPFRVTVPGVAGVDRYRVSFRTEAGVVRHVDRRALSGQLATVAPR